MIARRWWETRRFALAAVLLAAVPLLWPAVPPLTDMPGHIGRYHVAVSLTDSPVLQRHWRYDWQLIGNLGVDLAVLPLVPWLGVEGAAKLVVALIPPLTVAGLILLSRTVHGRMSPVTPFAFPLAYGFPFQLGFVNFALSAALALAALALWIRMRPGPWRGALFVPIALLLWVAHCFGWAMLCLFAFGSELTVLRLAGQGWRRAVLHAGLRCLPLAPPLLLMLGGGAAGAGGSAVSWEWLAKPGWVASLLRERWRAYDVAGATLLVLLCWAGLRTAALTTNRQLAAAAAMGALAWLALPYRLMGGAYVDMRIVPMVIALLIVAIAVRPGRERLAGRLALAGVAFFVVRIATTTIAFAQIAAGQERAAAIGALVPRGASVLVAVRVTCPAWSDDRLTHVAGLVLARRDIFDNSEWTLPGQQLLRDRRPDAGSDRGDPSHLLYDPRCELPSADLPTLARRFNRRAFRYVWTIGFPNLQPPAPDLQLVAQDGPSTLYRVTASSD